MCNHSRISGKACSENSYKTLVVYEETLRQIRAERLFKQIMSAFDCGAANTKHAATGATIRQALQTDGLCLTFFSATEKTQI